MLTRRIFLGSLATATGSGLAAYDWQTPTLAQARRPPLDPFVASLGRETAAIHKRMVKTRKATKRDARDYATLVRLSASHFEATGLDEAVKAAGRRIDRGRLYDPSVRALPDRLRADLRGFGVDPDAVPDTGESPDLALREETLRKLSLVGITPFLRFHARVADVLAESTVAGGPALPAGAAIAPVAYRAIDWSDDYWCNISSACGAGSSGGGGGTSLAEICRNRRLFELELEAAVLFASLGGPELAPLFLVLALDLLAWKAHSWYLGC
jgi:hypothetical protein